MAFTIIAGSSSTADGGPASTGRPGQGHIFYAVNQGAWCVPYLAFAGGQAHGLGALYSTNLGGTWTAPTGSPFTLANPHASEGRNFGFAYGNIAGTDVMHMASTYGAGAAATESYHARFTLGTTWNYTNTEALVGSSTLSGYPAVPSACVSCLTSGLIPVDANPYLKFGGGSGFLSAVTGAHADAGSSWTAGFDAGENGYGGSTYVESNALFSTGGGALLHLADDCTSTQGNFVQLEYQPLSAGVYGTAGKVLASSVTAADDNAWGAIDRTTSDIHVVALSDNSSNYVHRRWNGTSWSNGDAVPTLAYGTASGIRLISTGSNVWAGVFDTSKNLKVSKWTSGSGWGAWATQETARTNTPAYLTGAYDGTGHIMWAWTENNGGNYDIVGSAMVASSSPTNFGAALLGAM